MHARMAFVLLFLVLLLPSPAHSAGLSSLPPIETGFTLGYGNGHIHEGDYNPVLIGIHIGADLSQWLNFLKGHKGRLSIFAEPQFNPVRDSSDYEYGVGIGLKYMYPVTRDFSVFIMGSVGPHYISVDTSDQADGFIFADTIGAGFTYLFKNMGLSLGYRYRHMSNCDIKEPNGGINNHFGTLGYSYFF